ncbi:hypothetical protein ABKA04_005609 [Annulohypoxylon sp. FPYF3050]
MGAKVFHEDFLEMLNNAKNGAYERTGLDDDILRLPQEAPVLPMLIESLKTPIAFSSRLDSTVASAFQCATIMDHRRNLPPAPPNAPMAKKKRQISWLVTNVGMLDGNTTGGNIKSDDD